MKSIQNDSAAAEAELIAEAKHLTKHKTQLEVRMRILEEHNRQLEAQLQRLHLLLDQVPLPPNFFHMNKSFTLFYYASPSPSIVSTSLLYLCIHECAYYILPVWLFEARG